MRFSQKKYPNLHRKKILRFSTDKKNARLNIENLIVLNTSTGFLLINIQIKKGTDTNAAVEVTGSSQTYPRYDASITQRAANIMVDNLPNLIGNVSLPVFLSPFISGNVVNNDTAVKQSKYGNEYFTNNINLEKAKLSESTIHQPVKNIVNPAIVLTSIPSTAFCLN